ncbi:MAG: FAD-dependent oxidoreductase, partial [Holdemania filiformis]
MKLKKIFLPLLAALLFAGCSAAPEAPAPSGKFDAEVDYLIVGGGAAGIASAVEAADQGIENIMIVEKTGMLGGAAVYSGGIFGGVETQVTQALDLHVDIEDIIAEQQREKHYILDEELTRLTIESAGKTIDWMIDTLGVQFQPEVIVKDGYGTFQTIHLVEGEGSGLREPFEKAIADRAIDVRLNTEATALIMEDGRVIGAECVNENGETIRIKSKATLMATGGYSAH